MTTPNSQQLYRALEILWRCYTQAPMSYCEERPDSAMRVGLRWFSCAAAGADNRAILLGIDPELASTLTRDMFGGEHSQITGAQVLDAIGEMANIIAGSVNTLEGLEVGLQVPIKLEDDQVMRCFSDLELLAEVLIESDGLPCYLAITDGDLGVGGEH
ncbi:MAG: chemotaxis protein CheX [Cellvibrionaceae bacterium]